MASPSRQTRTSRTAGSARRADSQVPSSLSGIHRTWLTPCSLRAATTEGPSSMRYSGFVGLVAGGAVAELRQRRLDAGPGLLAGRLAHRLGLLAELVGQPLPGFAVAGRDRVLAEGL